LNDRSNTTRTFLTLSFLDALRNLGGATDETTPPTYQRETHHVFLPQHAPRRSDRAQEDQVLQ